MCFSVTSDVDISRGHQEENLEGACIWKNVTQFFLYITIEYTGNGSDLLGKGFTPFLYLTEHFRILRLRRRKGLCTSIYSFIHAFIYLTTIETLLHCWVLGAKQTKNSFLSGAHFYTDK